MRNSDPYAGIFYLMGIVFGAVVIISLLKGEEVRGEMTWIVILVIECLELMATLIKRRNESTIEQTKFNYILEQGLTILLILLCLVHD